MMRFIRADLSRLLRRRMTWILASLLVGITALVFGALLIALEGRDRPQHLGDLERATRFAEIVPFAFRVVLFQTVAIMTVILAGASTGAEFGWRTVVTMAAWTGDRRRLLAARFAAIGLLLGAAILLGFAVAVVCSLGLNAARGTLETGEIGASLVPDALAGAGRTWFVLAVYVASAIALAVWTRGTAAAIALPLVVLLLEPLGVEAVKAIGGPLEVIRQFSYSQNGSAILNQNGTVPGLEETEDLPGALQAYGLMGFYGGCALIAAFSTFMRRDIRD